MTHNTAPRPLEGVRVLELGQIYCGPYAGFLLARLGAEVIKIEPPTGELTRHRAAPGVEPIPYMLLNTNKRGMRLNLKHPEGKRIFLELAERSDVVLDNFATGVMDRLGLGFSDLNDLNPRLIQASASGFGNSGPNAGLTAMDLTVQAMTGVMSANGFADSPPVKAGVAVADFAGGSILAAGILAALYQRTNTGKGQRVEVSMQDALVPYLSSNISGLLASNGDYHERTGNEHGSLSVAPYNVYETSDGYVSILCAADRHWVALCDLMGAEGPADRSEFAKMTQRAARRDEVNHMVNRWTKGQRRTDIYRALSAAGIPVAPVNSIAEVLDDEHLHARGMLCTVDHPTAGTVLAYGSPMRFSGSEPVSITPSPTLGQHNTQVLHEILGLDGETIDRLRAESVI